MCAELVDVLDNLLALVVGECPSLLDGDRGGSGFLDIEIDDALATARALLAQPVVPDDIGLEWRPCVKLPITVHVRDQRPGETHSSTREGITPLRSDDLIMRGVRGEEYPIGRDLFEQTYKLLPTPEAND